MLDNMSTGTKCIERQTLCGIFWTTLYFSCLQIPCLHPVLDNIVTVFLLSAGFHTV